MDADRLNGKQHAWDHREVSFCISDVYVPPPATLLAELHGREVLRGKILEVSDSGATPEAFAVVDVAGLSCPVVVPVSKILSADLST